MSLFFSKTRLELHKTSEISGSEAMHLIGPRRIKVGEEIIFQDPQLNRFLCQVTQTAKNKLFIKPVKHLPLPPQAKTQLTLFQGYIAEQALDLVFQKATELNVEHIVIFAAKHSPHLPKDIDKKLQRWKKISLEAVKQSERAAPPAITYANSLNEALALNMPKNLYILDQAGKPFRKTKASKSVSLLVGPEGGLTPEELASAAPYKPERITLGPLVLRSETAALACIAAINTLYNS